MLHAARALAVLRGRRYVLPSDVHELAPDAMRHRLVLSYRALAEGVSADAIIGPRARAVPDAARRARERGGVSEVALALAPPTPARPGPGPVPETALRALDLTVRRRIESLLAGDHRAASLGIAHGARAGAARTSRATTSA